MSEGLRERFINALTATMELYDVIVDEQGRKIATLEETVLRLQGEVHEQQYELGRLRQDVKDHARWFEEAFKELDTLKQTLGKEVPS